MSEFDDPGSRVEAEVQNLLGAENELDPPGSNIEEMLTNLLNGDAVELKGNSRIEKLVKRVADEGGGGGDITVEALSVDANGTYQAPSGKAYSPVTVDVEPDLMAKSVTANGTYQAASDNVDGYSAVTVAVQPSVGTKSISANGTYQAASDDVDGYSSVTVDVEANVGTKSITQNGTYTATDEQLDGYSEVTVNISGSGGQEVPEKDVNFIDYDGTVLYSYTAQEALALTALPANPSHEGLTAQGWNYTLAEVKTEVNAVGGATVGQMYVTDDGKTRLYCTFSEGRTSPRFQLALNGTAVVDWGDGSATDTLTGVNEWTLQHVDHSYATVGDYVITIDITNGKANIYADIECARLISPNSSDAVFTAYANSIRKIELGNAIGLEYRGLARCASLESITIPNNIPSFGEKIFSMCYSLGCVVVPSGVTEILGSAFYYARSLEKCSLPAGLTKINANAFSDCSALSRLDIPYSVTNITAALPTMLSLQKLIIPPNMTTFNGIGSANALREIKLPEGLVTLGAITSCMSLPSLTIPSTVTTLSGYTFQNNYSVGEYHFKPTTPPPLSTTSAFSSIPSDCKIYVPAASLSAYKSATNWSAYSGRMIGE